MTARTGGPRTNRHRTGGPRTNRHRTNGHWADGHWDHIVVGAGSAGSVLAARLAADPDRRVLLLESGPDRSADEGPEHPLRVARNLVLRGHNWDHQVNLRGSDTRQRLLDGQDTDTGASAGTGAGTARAARAALPERARWARFPYPLGRGVGGSSAVNGAVALRALPSDFEAWAAAVGPDWAWSRVLPYFRRIEHDPEFATADPVTAGASGSDQASADLHGVGGPLPITRPDRIGDPDAALLAACIRMGIPERPDLNDGTAAGVGRVPANVVDGVRVDAATAFLNPVRTSPNLTVRPDTDVGRVLVERGRVTGVEILTAQGPQHLRADQVVLSAGAVASPVILLRSGIGDPRLCRALGIDPVVELVGVGEGLADHASVVIWALPRPGRTDPGRSGRRWRDVLARTSSGHDDRIDLQVGLLTGIDTEAIPGFAGRVAGGTVLGMSVMLACPESRGRVFPRPGDPYGPPVVELGIGSAAADLDRLVRGVRIGWELLNAPGVAEHLEHVQGWSARMMRDSEVLRRAVRNIANPGWHACGTARMGSAEDPWSVVDQHGRVYGVDGLRVVDASVFPIVPSTPTNLTTLMLAERIAEGLVAE